MNNTEKFNDCGCGSKSIKTTGNCWPSGASVQSVTGSWKGTAPYDYFEFDFNIKFCCDAGFDPSMCGVCCRSRLYYTDRDGDHHDPAERYSDSQTGTCNSTNNVFHMIVDTLSGNSAPEHNSQIVYDLTIIPRGYAGNCNATDFNDIFKIGLGTGIMPT